MRAVERLKELEHRGYHFEAADASFDLLLRKEAGDYEPLFRLESFRVITEKREDGKVQTEATIKIWAEGRAARPHRRGQRPGERARPGAARRDRRHVPAPARHRPRQLQGADHRRAQGHRRRHARADRRVRRRRDVGHDRRLGEHHRGELGGARGLARVRHAGAPGDRRRRRAARRAGRTRRRPERRADPAGAAGRRPARGGAGAARCCARAACRWGRCSSASSASSRPGSGTDGRGGRLERDRGAAPRRAGARVGHAGDEVVTTPFSFVASANCLLYEDATPVFCDIDPRHAEHRSASGRGGLRAAHGRAAAGPHVRLPGRHGGARGARRRSAGSASWRTPARRSGAVDAAGRQGRRARQPGGVRASMRTSSSPPARAGC